MLSWWDHVSLQQDSCQAGWQLPRHTAQHLDTLSVGPLLGESLRCSDQLWTPPPPHCRRHGDPAPNKLLISQGQGQVAYEGRQQADEDLVSQVGSHF